MGKYTKMETIGAALEMTAPSETYKGGTISWQDANWMYEQLKKLIALPDKLKGTEHNDYYALVEALENIKNKK